MRPANRRGIIELRPNGAATRLGIIENRPTYQADVVPVSQIHTSAQTTTSTYTTPIITRTSHIAHAVADVKCLIRSHSASRPHCDVAARQATRAKCRSLCPADGRSRLAKPRGQASQAYEPPPSAHPPIDAQRRLHARLHARTSHYITP